LPLAILGYLNFGGPIHKQNKKFNPKMALP